MSEHISIKKEINKITETEEAKRDSGLGNLDWQIMKDTESDFNSWLSGTNKEGLEQGLAVYQKRIAENEAGLRENTARFLPDTEFNEQGSDLEEMKRKLEKRVKAIKEKLETIK